MGEASDSESRPWWKRLLTIPGLVLTTALTAAVSWGATEVLSGIKSDIKSGAPLALSLETNPALAGAFADEPIYAVIPGEVRTTGTPGEGCQGFRGWVRRQGGVDARTTKFQLTVQGRVPEAVLISSLRVKILGRERPVTGVPVVCPPAAEAQFRAVSIDLDAIPPRVRYHSGEGKDFGFTVAEGETETFNVVASARKAHYRWEAELVVVVDGERRTLEIDDHGQPFETTAATSRAWWSWDYSGAWFGSGPGAAGSARSIPGGTALPPLR
jgi:hypothetical protein